MDKQTGYRTKSLLCCPIFGPSKNIVGVAQLINKIEKGKVTEFTDADENIFNAFATFCGLAIQKTILYEEITQQRHQLEVSLDIMSYHATAKIEDYNIYISNIVKIEVPRLEEIRDPLFDSHHYGYDDDRLVALTWMMFEDLGYTREFEISKEKLGLYILTIRKNYRRNMYHNFTHAVSVLHGAYLMIRSNTFKTSGLDDLDLFAILISALNHDIDHRGTNNQFQIAASTALAGFYNSSTLERHHFNQYDFFYDFYIMFH
jgi:dual 3',5'-cyclic-AMP and -GMP phosphodiesterase 11